MTIITFILEATIGLIFLLFALGVLVRSPSARRLLDPLPKSRIGRLTAAVFSILPAIGMLGAIGMPFLAFFAANLSIVVIAGLMTATRFGGGRGTGLFSTVIVLATISVAVIQPLGLKVLSLPKADTLRYSPIPATVLKTYDEGVWFESVRAGADGTLYLAANRGLDFSSSEYYQNAEGSVIAHSRDGSERTLFTTPIGSTAGVMAIAGDGTIYMASNGTKPGLWQITKNGQGTKLTELPTGAWPNGLDFGPDGMLYTSDSNLACVWRIDPHTGRFNKILADELLAARPFIALAPGANGLHFVGRDMIVTVSDSTEVLKYRLGTDDRFGEAVLIAKGIPGDDFAEGPDGSLFITTHPYNTLVRVSPDGNRTIVGNARQHIIGATDAVFGRGPDDRDTLYVATDGGAFTGGSRMRGELIALKPYAAH